MEIDKRFVHPGYIKQELERSEVYYYLDKYIDQDIFIISNLEGNPKVKQSRVIWVFWLQGMENAPKLAQICFESICRNKPKDFEVVLLTKENLEQYIHLPSYIWKKYEEGYISVAHLSDLVRLELLCTYGGCWIDATVYCSGAIPEYMVKGDLFLFQASSLEIPVIKMSNWWLASNKDNRLIHAIRKTLHRFWQQENDVKNYFIFHIIMSKLIDEDPVCKAIFKRAPYCNNGNPHILYFKLGMEFDEREWEIIKQISTVHKLTHKIKYLQGDIYNYYMALMEGKLV